MESERKINKFKIYLISMKLLGNLISYITWITLHCKYILFVFELSQFEFTTIRGVFLDITN